MSRFYLKHFLTCVTLGGEMRVAMKMGDLCTGAHRLEWKNTGEDKTRGNKIQSLPPTPPPRSLGKHQKGETHPVSPSWREEALIPSSSGSAGLSSQWPRVFLGLPISHWSLCPLKDSEEEDDGEAEYELPPCKSLPLKMVPASPPLLDKNELYLDRSIIPGPPKPVPQPASALFPQLLSALSLQKAAGEGDRFGRKDLAASGSTDLAGEDDNEEAIYLEPSPASSTNQALGFQAPPPATMFPRPTITPRSAYKPASVCQETQSDGTYTVRPSSDPQGWKPFTLAVFFHNHVYNIPIRWLDAKRQYALGRESKSYEKLFPNVAAMIQHFSEHPLLLVNRHTGDRHHTCLLFPTKSRLPQ
ncbi:SH2 domain-containing protein 6 isoform X11 [Notamacropus eugenii]|uniref:SH2 domain-containing protein 6 isoform X11 n=1 Tax=Notamacropus eugenii TaxID=9315 RepID=UPI003B66C2D5